MIFRFYTFYWLYLVIISFRSISYSLLWFFFPLWLFSQRYCDTTCRLGFIFQRQHYEYLEPGSELERRSVGFTRHIKQLGRWRDNMGLTPTWSQRIMRVHTSAISVVICVCIHLLRSHCTCFLSVGFILCSVQSLFQLCHCQGMAQMQMKRHSLRHDHLRLCKDLLTLQVGEVQLLQCPVNEPLEKYLEALGAEVPDFIRVTSST